MPDPTITSRDLFQRAKADAEAKYGRWRPMAPTLSVCLASSMIVMVTVGIFGMGADPAWALEVATVVIGVATLLAYVYEARRLKKKSRLIDQRWQMLRAETARLRATRITSWQGLVDQRRG